MHQRSVYENLEQSERQESNLLCPDPKSGGLPFAFTPMVPRVRVERTSPHFQRGAFTGLAAEGLVTPAGDDPAPAP